MPCRHACFNLEEYESAQEAFEAASQLEPGKQIHKTWVDMCRVRLGGERAAGQPASQLCPFAGQLGPFVGNDGLGVAMA